MYHLVESTDETIRFIETYLSEDESIIPSNKSPEVIRRRWKEITDDINQPGVNKTHIADYILKYFPAYSKEKYGKFLKTYYWTIIADKVKLTARFMCQLNTSHENDYLHAHHSGYGFHGRELQNVEMIICLCHDCHEKFHLNLPIRVEVPAIEVQVPVIGERLPTPKKIKVAPNKIEVAMVDDLFDSALITQNYINYKLSVLDYLVDTRNLRLKL
jgi:hypothetical protein